MGTEHLLTTSELAEHCGISYQYLRDCFAEGLLPEPKFMFKHARKTTRRFSMREADAIKRIFASDTPNKFKDVRRRARIRKQIQEGEVKNVGTKNRNKS